MDRTKALEGADPAVVAAQLQDLLHHRPVLALQLPRQGGRRVHVRALVDGHAQDAVRPALGRAGHAPVQRHERRDLPSPEGDPLRHFGHDADLREAAFPPRNEEDAGLPRDIDRERHRHARKDHGVVEWDQPEISHG